GGHILSVVQSPRLGGKLAALRDARCTVVRLEATMASKSKPKPRRRPDEVALTKTSAARLAEITGVSAEKLAGRSVLELRKELEWVIDPNLFEFRRVCGRVVKHDPVSGDDWG